MIFWVVISWQGVGGHTAEEPHQCQQVWRNPSGAQEDAAIPKRMENVYAQRVGVLAVVLVGLESVQGFG